MAFWGRKKNREIDTETRETKKKPGIMKRLWHKFRSINWKDPVNRWKFLFASLVFCIIVFGGGYGVLSYTNSPTFCSNCHEMTAEYTTYTASAHNQITCVQCHIKPGMVNMMTHKVKSLKEVYYHVTGVPNQIVQTAEEAVSNENCLQCHSKNRLVTASGDLKVNHKGHIKENIPCITCHAGVVHAKVAARGINVEKDLANWNQANAEKLIEQKYLRPNMGTCIDCHDKVNKGQKPWKQIEYSVPANPEETKKPEGAVEVAAAGTKASEPTAIPVTNTPAQTAEQATAEKDKNTQDIILQAIGKEKKNVKISMECTTCHKQIKVPQSHKATGWDHQHGATAIQKLDKCVNCHQDSKWVRDIPKEDIMSLLNMGNHKVKYNPNITVVRSQARINKFCVTCHANRPPGHLNSDQWLTAHSQHAQTDEQKSQCFVCHDRTKPIPGSTDIKAPTDVYCQFCHRTGFKNEKKL